MFKAHRPCAVVFRLIFKELRNDRIQPDKEVFIKRKKWLTSSAIVSWPSLSCINKWVDTLD